MHTIPFESKLSDQTLRNHLVEVTYFFLATFFAAGFFAQAQAFFATAFFAAGFFLAGMDSLRLVCYEVRPSSLFLIVATRKFFNPFTTINITYTTSFDS